MGLWRGERGEKRAPGESETDEIECDRYSDERASIGQRSIMAGMTGTV